MGLVQMRWHWKSGPRTGVLVKKGSLDTDCHAEKRQPPADRHRGKPEAENAAMPSWTKAPRGCQKLGEAGTDRPLEPGRERAPAHTWVAGFWLPGGKSIRTVISGPSFVALCCRSPGKLVTPALLGCNVPGAMSTGGESETLGFLLCWLIPAISGLQNILPRTRKNHALHRPG